MASLATANLPSSDEEDDDYDPSMDPTGEKEPGKQGTASGARNRRGAAAAAMDGEAAADDDDEEDGEPAAAGPSKAAAAAATAAGDDDDTLLTPAQTAKKARISAMWEQLHTASTGSANKLARSSISLASLCSNTDPKKKRNTDLLWMRNLGITPASKKAKTSLGAATPAAATGDSNTHHAQTPATAAAHAGTSEAVNGDKPSGEPAPTAAAETAAAAAGTSIEQQQQQQQPAPSSAIRSAAAAALAAAREAAAGGVGSSYNKVVLKETRRFAGKDIEVEVKVDKDSKEAKRAAERAAAASGGLDSFLQQIEAKKKVTVLDKSKMDWEGFKATDTEVQEELEAHRRSDKQYLERQDFLKRAELREYEIERDKRLASDVRLRGRL